MKEKWMRRALELARGGIGAVNPNPLVGAVIVKEGRVIGEGFHTRFGAPHAEREALAAATESVAGATMYVTLEPCSHHGKTPPCTEAIIAAGIARVIVGLRDPNPLVAGRGIEQLKQAGIEVEVGVLEKALSHQNRMFLTGMEKKRPRVLMKAAMSLDGKIATRTGSSKWITGPEARAEVHRMRHEWPAILVGIGTVLADDPSLSARSETQALRQPTRIIVDAMADTPVDARVLDPELGGPTIVAVTDAAPAEKVRAIEKRGARLLRMKGREGRIDLSDLLHVLYDLGIDGVLVEGGSGMHGAFFDADLVDEVVFFLAPLLIGGREAKPVIGGEGCETLVGSKRLGDMKIEQRGADLMITGTVRRVEDGCSRA